MKLIYASVVGWFMLVTTAPAADLTVVIKDRKGRSPEGTIIELVGSASPLAQPVSTVINQRDREFQPLVSVIPQNSPVLFRNDDEYKHHVYSVSEGNQFDIPLYSGNPPDEIFFTRPGVVKLGCNIHDWMLAYAYINQGELLVTVDAGGEAVFRGLDAGDYEVRVWNPKLRNNKRAISESVTLLDEERATVEIQVALRKKLSRPAPKLDADSYEF